MSFELRENILNCVVGGLSALDIPVLDINSLEEASSFVRSYGYDTSNEKDLNWLWLLHRRAVILINENLLEEGEAIPEDLADPKLLGDIRNLLLYASNRELAGRDRQRWSCGILRVMHVHVHLENDLFSNFSDSIQEQILRPIQKYISVDKVSGSTWFYGERSGKKVALHKFSIKPYKLSHSSIVKLLAKPNMFALTLLDKLGVRFITKSVVDVFRVVEILVLENLISFPHIIPDQSNNTIYPTSVFVDVMQEADKQNWDDTEIEKQMEQQLKISLSQDEDGLLKKKNDFSAEDFRFVKFINRRRVLVENADGPDLSFFYPFEIQIMDYESYMVNLTGPTAHEYYKERQRQAARRRVFGKVEV